MAKVWIWPGPLRAKRLLGGVLLRLRPLRLSFLLLGSVPLWAHAESDKENTAQISITIKPGLCLRFARGERCDVDVDIKWRAGQLGRYCVFSESNTASPIKCWDRAASGQVDTKVSIEGDLRFWLSDQQGSTVLAETVLRLATVIKNQNRDRHGRRHIWNLI